ncbi:17940_t:CDS:2 [Acaulospora morrowiae]|uniref:17940_t:CDS:1 n=1 Tax=Acaulospora morrowiae TaxID=94023 RepID=A0A9N9FY97_9GLOM|nr:17940_t:CDS:2 [Acaulospora morrowiae]
MTRRCFVSCYCTVFVIFSICFLFSSQTIPAITNPHEDSQHIIIFRSTPSAELIQNLTSNYKNVGRLISFSENLHMLPGDFGQDFTERFKDQIELVSASEVEDKEKSEDGKPWIVVRDEVVRTVDNVVLGKESEEENDKPEKKRFRTEDSVYGGAMLQKNVQSWGLDRIDQRALPLSGTYSYPDSAGNQVDAYIIDTGINLSHPEFEGRAKWGKTTISSCKVDDDENGHGTFVAGIIGGKTYGVAKKVNLIAVKSLDVEGMGSIRSVLYGFEYVIQSHKSKGRKAKSVANLSIGTTYNRAVNLAVNELVSQGISITVNIILFYAFSFVTQELMFLEFLKAAAGNGDELGKGIDACSVSPASARSAITVGSIDPTDVLSEFSNFGECVNLFAPGQKILSSHPYQSSGTSIRSGTSFACPYVAGVVALLLSESKYAENLRPKDISTLIQGLATKDVIIGLQGTGSPNLLLYNKVDEIVEVIGEGVGVMVNGWYRGTALFVWFLIVEGIKIALTF